MAKKRKLGEVVELGDKVRDPITGFTGITTCKMSYLTGCDRFDVTEEKYELADGIPRMSIMCFDEPVLEILKKGVHKIEITKDLGGPKDNIGRGFQK